MPEQRIVILELGGERAAQIAWYVRSLGVYTVVSDPETVLLDVRNARTAGVLIIGAPDDVNSPSAKRLPPELFEIGKPILCVGYAMYAMVYALMGRVEKYVKKLAPKSRAVFDVSNTLFEGMNSNITVENFYKYGVTILPRGFRSTACTSEFPNLAMCDEERKIYGLQPLVDEDSSACILKNFLMKICGCIRTRTAVSLEEQVVDGLRASAKKGNVLVAVSGGVLSLVCIAACMKSFPGRCRFAVVDHGLFREGEIEEMKKLVSFYGSELAVIDVSARTMAALNDIVPYNEKRALIREIIVKELKNYAKNDPDIGHIVLGVSKCERASDRDEYLKEITGSKEIILPFVDLYRNEVRGIGKLYGFSVGELSRHRFSVAALAGYISDDVTDKKLELVRKADHILCDEMSRTRCKTKKLMSVLFKPIADEENYCVALRAVTMYGAFGPTFVPVPYRVLSKISERITDEIPEITRIAFDISDVSGVNSEYI